MGERILGKLCRARFITLEISAKLPPFIDKRCAFYTQIHVFGDIMNICTICGDEYDAPPWDDLYESCDSKVCLEATRLAQKADMAAEAAADAFFEAKQEMH